MATDPEQVRSRIEEIDAILRCGASNVTVDGVNVQWDHDELRKERHALEIKLPQTKRRRRRMSFGNNIGGAF